MQKIIYKRNRTSRKTGIIFSFIVLIVGIGIGIYLKFFLDTVSNAFAALDLLLIILGVFLVLYNLIYSKSVIVSYNGIYTYVNSIKLIPWKHISGLEIKFHKGKNYLLILIDEPKLFVLQKKLRARELMKLNMKEIGNPVAIPETEFNKPLLIVKEEIEEFRKTNVNNYQQG